MPATQHGYSYSHNNPLNFTDFSGECVWDFCITEGTIVIVAGTVVVTYVAARAIYHALEPYIPNMSTAAMDFVEGCQTLLFSNPPQKRPQTQTGTQPKVTWEDLAPPEVMIDIAPLPGPQPDPKPTSPGIDFTPPRPTPDDNDKIIRVRHYSQSIDQIKASQEIVSGLSGPLIFVEYPITTPRDIDSIQQTTRSFYGPLNGVGGFVDFNVDLNKWIVSPDPNLTWVTNAKVINPITVDGSLYMRGTSMYFPLDAPNVMPVFYDWKGDILP
jgi:hypothetical protein